MNKKRKILKSYFLFQHLLRAYLFMRIQDLYKQTIDGTKIIVNIPGRFVISVTDDIHPRNILKDLQKKNKGRFHFIDRAI